MQPQQNSKPGRKSALSVLWRVVGVIVFIVVVYFGFTFIQVWRASRQDQTKPAQAIIVLGAAQYNGVPSPDLAARLDHAITLYNDRVAPVIVVTGGKQPGDKFTEATAGANYLHAHGIPDQAILRETTGDSSWESLAASAHILKARRMTKVVLVSDPFHSERIRLTADQLGLHAETSPTRTSPITGLSEIRYFISETGRVGVGRFVGFRRVGRNGPIGKLVKGVGTISVRGALTSHL